MEQLPSMQLVELESFHTLLMVVLHIQALQEALQDCQLEHIISPSRIPMDVPLQVALWEKSEPALRQVYAFLQQIRT